MSYLSLYRKYRPKTFKDVIGQEYVVQILRNSVKNSKIANAYVFAGVKGTGKTSIAKIFANAINCLDSQDGDVCNKCEVCNEFANNQLLDVIELDAASNSGVDEARQIVDGCATLPTKFKKKVYIIDEAHMLTPQAWNALLKTVEEPPEHVVFIFATTEIHKVPATILSRCQCFTFNKLQHSQVVQLLTKVCKAENIKYDLDALKIVADIVDGSARDALSTLEQLAAYSNNDIKVDDVYKNFGLLNSMQVVEFINYMVTNNSQSCFDTMNKYFATGINLLNFTNLLVSILTDKLIFLKTQNEKLLNRTNLQNINDLKINDFATLIALIDVWQDAYYKASTPTDVNTIINHAILKSLALFNNEQLVVQEQPTVKHVAPKTEAKSEPELDFDHAFVVTSITTPKKEVKVEQSEQEPIFEQPKTEIKIEQPKVDLVMPQHEEILFACISNKNKTYIQQANEILSKLQNGDFNEKALSRMALAKGVAAASPNAIVLVFGDELDAELFNRNATNHDFILACCKVFRNPKFIVGFSISQINALKEQVKEAMRRQIPLLNIEILRNILNQNQSIEQIAFNTIYKNFDENERIKHKHKEEK